MNKPDVTHVFLPSWRDGRLLFFTDVKDNYTTRLDYRVAAATAPGETTVKRSFKAPISAKSLALCQETADNGPALQKFFRVVGGGNIGDLTSENLDYLPPCATGASPLIYVCSYLNFLRKYAVDQTLVKNYESAPVGKRFHMESSLSIYKILSSHMQPQRAMALIRADIPDIQKVSGAKTAVANLLREVAIINFDAEDTAAAIEAMLHAAKLCSTEDKWRRLADFAIAAGKPEDAITHFTSAEALAPLAPPPAFRMAKLLVDAGRFEEAAPFLNRAEAVFAKPIEALRQRITAAQQGKA